MRNAKRTERKVNAIINEILDEDQENNFSATRSETCPESCRKSDNTIKKAPQQCSCAIENSSRFSLRVMEAMRSLQRDVDQLPTSSAEDIVDYIRANYHNDGDLYAQVRTALRQVCSQGFVIKLLDNEYHLIGPIVRSTKRNGCSLDCTGRPSMAMDETSRRWKSINKNGFLYKQISRRPYQPSRRDPRSPREKSLRRTSVVDRLKDRVAGPILHSTRISGNEINNTDYRDREIDSEELSPYCNCEDTLDAQDDYRQRDAVKTREIQQREEFLSPIPGPSTEIVRTPVSPKNARKKIRLEDRTVKHTDEDTTTEEDVDCICDTDVVQVDQDAHLRKRLPDRTRVVTKNRRNGRRHEDEEEDEEEKEEDGEEEEEEEEEEEDEDTEDSAYRQLRKRSPRRTRARERELKRWIRRCREECERRRAR